METEMVGANIFNCLLCYIFRNFKIYEFKKRLILMLHSRALNAKDTFMNRWFLNIARPDK